MRRWAFGTFTSTLAAVAMVAVVTGTAASGGVRGGRAPSIGPSSKTAFCTGNVAIDKASSSVTSAAGFLAVLKSHSNDLKLMEQNLPSGAVGQDARAILATAQKAIATNSASVLMNATVSGGAVDTYCGVDGSGNPLPADFAKGQGTTFCRGFLPIFQAVGNASSAQGAVAALTAHKSELAKLSTEVTSLPTSIRAKAQATISDAQAAIRQQSASPLGLNGQGPAGSVALYCGQNE